MGGFGCFKGRLSVLGVVLAFLGMSCSFRRVVIDFYSGDSGVILEFLCLR